ncbi:MAG TPA: hypothetical protein VIJ54_10665 [Actinomycetes bacterium]
MVAGRADHRVQPATTAGHQIFLVPAAGGTSTPLGRSRAGCDATQPAWAADWEIAYTCAGTGIAVQWPTTAPRLIVPDSYASEPAFTAGSKHLVYLSLCAPGLCQEVAVWETTARGASRHQIDSPIAQRWTCAEGDICLASVTGSPYGGWAEAGTYSDTGEGGSTTFTCYQGAIDNGNGDIPLTPPSFCVTGYAPAFAVRPA